MNVTLDDTKPVAAGNISLATVYNDTNFDGTKDNGETGIANVLVYLDADSSQNGAFNVATDPFIFTTAAAANNPNYTFFGLANGSYNVFEIPASGFDQTQPKPATAGYLGVSPPASGLNFGDATDHQSADDTQRQHSADHRRSQQRDADDQPGHGNCGSSLG